MNGRNRRVWIALGLILLTALLLRVIRLGERSLWYDEAFAVLFSEKGWDAMIDGTLTQVDGVAADMHPPVYYETLHFWMKLFGDSPTAVRFYSVLLGVLTVGAVFGLARDWFGARAGLAAALITAVAPFHVQYSQETRMYALLAFVLVLDTWVLWRAVQRGKNWYWVAFGVLSGAAMYIQQLAAMYLLALGLLPLLTRKSAVVVRTALATLIAGVIYLPWMLHLPGQMDRLHQYWVSRPNVLHLWLALRSFTSVNLDFSPAWWLPTFFVAALLTVMLLYRGRAMLSAKSRYPETQRQALQWVLWLVFVPMIVMWVVSYVVQPVFLPRALIPSAVMLYVALGWLFTGAGIPRPIVKVLVMMWGVVIGFGLITLYTWDTFPTPPFDQASTFLQDEMQSGDMIVHGNKITALPMVNYGRDLPQQYVRDIPGSGSDTLAMPTQKTLGLFADDCVAQAANGAPRVWYVTFEKLEDEMVDLVKDDAVNAQYDSLEWLKNHYVEKSKTAFSDLYIYLFTNPDTDALQAVCGAEG